jgi:hypothetical protein
MSYIAAAIPLVLVYLGLLPHREDQVVRGAKDATLEEAKTHTGF